MRKLLVLLSIFWASAAIAGEMPAQPPAASPELNQIRQLAGKWQGMSKGHDGKEETINVEYAVTSGGSAVVETIFKGTPHEMVSVYHDKAGKLSMTHYCMLGNQPELDLQSDAAGKMDFEASTQTKAALSGQPYMNALRLDASQPDHLIQTWGGVSADGKPNGDATVIELKKVK